MVFLLPFTLPVSMAVLALSSMVSVLAQVSTAEVAGSSFSHEKKCSREMQSREEASHCGE